MRTKCFVVASSHWDREWYRSFESFRLRLCDMVKALLDQLDRDPDFKCYTLDGQTAPLEDYLEIHPEDRERLRFHIGSGRIAIGPFFVLADSFLVSGEGLLRNLAVGRAMALEFGAVSLAGYLPDMFGHSSQMPQILAGFGIDNAILFRGMEARICKKSEFLWRGADGTVSLGYHLAYGYWNLKSWGLLGQSPEEQFGDLLGRLDGRSATKCHLMINGSDHLYTQPEMPDFVRSSARAFPEVEVENASLDDFTRELRKRATGRKLETVAGELRYARDAQINASVYSTRGDIKRENRKAETLLERFAEPFSAFACALGAPYPRAPLARAWKELLRNYPHDSICAASTDEVHEDVLARYRHSTDVATELFQIASGRIAGHISMPSAEPGDRMIVVFNPLAWARKEAVEVSVDIPSSLAPRDLELFAPEGSSVDYELLGVDEAFALKENPYTSKEKIPVRRFRILFLADLPPTGFAAYRVSPRKLRDKRLYQQRQMLAPMGDSIENEFYVVSVDRSNCTVSVEEKTSGKVWRGLNAFCDAGDCGDEYQYAAPFGNDVRYPVLEGLSIERNTPNRSVLKLRLLFLLPKSLEADRLSRSKDSIPCRLETSISLFKGIGRVDFTTTFDNKAEDHILYVRFPSEATDGEDFAHSPFDIVRRPVEVPPVEEGDNEIVTPFKPMQAFAGVGGGGDCFAVANRGLYEYRTDREKGGICLSLTLLRAVGWLFKETQASSRDGQPCTTPVVATPGSQCKGVHAFEYSFIPAGAGILEKGRHKTAFDFSVPVEARVFDPPGTGELPPSLSFINISNPLAVLSSVTADGDGGLLLRCYNVSDEGIPVDISCPFPVMAAFRCDMLGAHIAGLAVEGGQIRFHLRGKEIMTLKISLGGARPDGVAS